MRLTHFFFASGLLVLSGCSLFTSQEAVQGQGNSAQWQAHKQQIAAIDGWQISGKMGIRAPSDSGSATLFWLQRQDYFDIRLSGPLGSGAARLSGHPDEVLLDIANQGQFRANSPEDLLEARLGWRLPISNLFWWVRGLPAPNSKSRVTLDGNSHLAQLEQDGWQIDYLGYSEQAGYNLPERIKLKGADLQITLVIKDWQPRRLGQ